jgi:hypothetical protein
VPSTQGDALATRGIPARLAFILAASIVPAALLALLLIGYDYYDRERDRPRGSSHCSRRWALRRSSAAG